MFNIGPQELLLILVLALLVVGPRRLPEIARTVGKGIRELRKAQDEVRKTIQVNLDEPSPAAPRTRSPRRLPVDDEAPGSDARAPAGDAGAPSGTDVDAPPASGSDLAAPPASGSDLAAPAAAAAEPSAVTEVSRSLGRTLAELRRAREEVQRSFRVDLDPEPPRSRPRPARDDGNGLGAADPERPPEGGPAGGSDASPPRAPDPDRPS